MKAWIRLDRHHALGAYDAYEATGKYPEPEWGDLPLVKLLEIAFRDRFINRPDHPVLRRLRGEV